jgi:hypothetical protein
VCDVKNITIQEQICPVKNYQTLLIFVHVGASTRSWKKNSTVPFHFWHSVFDLQTHSYNVLHFNHRSNEFQLRTNSAPSKQIIHFLQYRPLFYFTTQFILYSPMLFLQMIYYLPYPTQAKCSGSTVLPNNIRLFIQQHTHYCLIPHQHLQLFQTIYKIQSYRQIWNTLFDHIPNSENIF